jgi:hypothetical protein
MKLGQNQSNPITVNQTKSNQIKPAAGKNGLAGDQRGRRNTAWSNPGSGGIEAKNFPF